MHVSAEAVAKELHFPIPPSLHPSITHSLKVSLPLSADIQDSLLYLQKYLHKLT